MTVVALYAYGFLLFISIINNSSRTYWLIQAQHIVWWLSSENNVVIKGNITFCIFTANITLHQTALKTPSSNDRIIIGHHTTPVPSLTVLSYMNMSMFDIKIVWWLSSENNVVIKGNITFCIFTANITLHQTALKTPSSNDRIIIGHHTTPVPSLTVLSYMNMSMFDIKIYNLDLLWTQFTFYVLRPEI